MIKIKNLFQEYKKMLDQYTWWELSFFVIGLISTIVVLVILFLPLGKGPDSFTTVGNAPSVSSPEFPKTISSSLNLPYRQGEALKVLNNGDAFMPSFISDIDAAVSSINIMLYIWESGTMSKEVFEHLDEKLKEGVEVRIILDAFGSAGAERDEEFKKFKKLGGEVEIFHSLTIVPWNMASNHKRAHQRAIVIDGKIGYTGGMAIKDSWLGNARNSEEWRDMMFRVTGNMAQDIQGAFTSVWSNNTGELLLGDKFYPPVSDRETLHYVSLVSVPSPDSLLMQKFILLSFLGAQDKIYITNPYFLMDQASRDILIDKSKNGVDVRILVPNKLNDSGSVRAASQKSYEELLENGIKIYEYQSAFLHSKTIVIDGSWSIIGSANMDNRSRELNEENVFGILDKSFGSELEKVFLEDLNHTQQINLSDWKDRGLWQRFKEIFSLKFVQQY